LAPGERATIERAIGELRSLADATNDADRLFAALNEFDRGTVRLAELAITQTLKQQDDVATSTGHK
jgi:hypothetical protein